MKKNTHCVKQVLPSVLWCCWLGSRKGIRPVKTEWWGAGVVICLERGADLHMAQLMPLPLTVSCFSKIRLGFTFLVPAHLGSPGQRAVKRVCVCVCVKQVVCGRIIWERIRQFKCKFRRRCFIQVIVGCVRTQHGWVLGLSTFWVFRPPVTAGTFNLERDWLWQVPSNGLCDISVWSGRGLVSFVYVCCRFVRRLFCAGALLGPDLQNILQFIVRLS